MPDLGDSPWSMTHGERLARLEGDVRRLASDYEKFEGALRQVTQVGESTERLLKAYSEKFENMTSEMRALATELAGAVSRVQAIEATNQQRREAESVAKEVRAARLNTVQMIGGVILATVSIWGGRVAAGLADLLKLLPGGR